jgi:hypothetical protein
MRNYCTQSWGSSRITAQQDASPAAAAPMAIADAHMTVASVAASPVAAAPVDHAPLRPLLWLLLLWLLLLWLLLLWRLLLWFLHPKECFVTAAAMAASVAASPVAAAHADAHMASDAVAAPLWPLFCGCCSSLVCCFVASSLVADTFVAAASLAALPSETDNNISDTFFVLSL